MSASGSRFNGVVVVAPEERKKGGLHDQASKNLLEDVCAFKKQCIRPLLSLPKVLPPTLYDSSFQAVIPSATISISYQYLFLFSATTKIMDSSSGMSIFFRTCTVLAFVIASEASRFIEQPASITPAPAVATIGARSGTDGIRDGVCGPSDQYAKATAGASCESMALENGITMDEFLLMNPVLSPSCTNLEAGSKYCVAAAGYKAPTFSCSGV